MLGVVYTTQVEYNMGQTKLTTRECDREMDDYKNKIINSNTVFTTFLKYYLKVCNKAYYFLNTTSSR
jgi:hypothetical protein